ncbi:MAG: MFS transporter [Syntrophomonadaceae bacterium]
MQNQPIHKKMVLLAIGIASFLPPFMISAINIALPAIQSEFAINAVMLGWVVTSYLLSTAVFLLPAGKIGDIFGRKRLYMIGVTIFSLSSVLIGFMPSIASLIVMRIIQGFGAAIAMTTSVAIISSVFPVHQRGSALGINVAAVYVGLALGPTLGGLLTAAMGWRSIFFIMGPLGLAAVILIRTFITGEWADAHGQSLDIFSCIIYGAAIISLTYGFTQLPDVLGIILLMGGLAGIILFARRQMAIPFPVFEVGLFKSNRVFAFSNIAALINYGASAGSGFLLSLYLQYITGLSVQLAGLVLVSQPVIMAILSPVAGRLSDKYQPSLIASAGMTFTALGLFMLVFLTNTTPVSYIIAALMVMGVGFSLFGSPNTNAIMSSIMPQYYGIASGAVSTMRLLGQNFSLATTTLIISLVVGKAQITPETYDAFLRSVNITFIVFSLLCASGIYFSYARGNLKNRKSPN